jgi:hypothetical protein
MWDILNFIPCYWDKELGEVLLEEDISLAPFFICLEGKVIMKEYKELPSRLNISTCVNCISHHLSDHLVKAYECKACNDYHNHYHSDPRSEAEWKETFDRYVTACEREAQNNCPDGINYHSANCVAKIYHVKKVFDLITKIKKLKEDLSNAWNKFHAVRHENNKLRKENERLTKELEKFNLRMISVSLNYEADKLTQDTK